MKKPDLLILIAIWEFLTAFFALIGISAITMFAFPAVLGYWGNWGFDGNHHNAMIWNYGDIARTGVIFGLSIATFVLVCFCAIALISAVGLLKGKEWGRNTAIVHGAVSLICFPVGTAAGGLSIMYLIKQEVKQYFMPPKGHSSE
jgi:hypothetical protein